MAYKYTHFIPQNTAPKGAKSIVVYNGNNEKVTEISLGKMSPPKTEPLYSFGIISDLHITYNLYVAWQPIPKFDNALTLFENKGCAFCVACGDLTNTGFYLRTDEGTAGTEYLDEQQFTKYKEICDKHTIPVYELCGNHESYYGMSIADNLDLLETYTGKGVLSYTVTQGNDVFILCGQNHGSSVMSDEDFTWLGETLEANKNKRCFVFVHSHIDDNVEGGVEDSGNPCYARENSIFGYWGATKRTNFINLMKQYPNTILFHGHTHMKFEAQKFDKDANYSEENGFRSVHVPSSGAPRELVSADGTWVAADDESQGYIVDVYENYIVLNGVDIINQKPVPLGVYKIDTTLQTIDPVSISNITYSGVTDVGATIDTSAFSYTVTYSDGSTAVKTDAVTVSPSTITVAGNNTVTVTYTENGITVTGTVTIVGVEQSGEVTETLSPYYADGYRLPANDPYGMEESAGATATMDIDITHAKKPITFNLTGIQWWDILENPNCLIGLYGYDENWAPYIIEVLPLCANTSRTGLTVSGNYFNVTITLDDSYMDNVTMVRFSGIGVGENAVITMTYTK
ncbi:MAG: hypothetical protein E7293_03445 [Lachnospiraceae bacterium]|nr:hypothetical protein [Lachnospiraceae bacterium]